MVDQLLPPFLREHVQESPKIIKRKYGEETRFYLEGIKIIQRGEYFTVIVGGVEVSIIASEQLDELLRGRLNR
jgi:hypothetical protein